MKDKTKSSQPKTNKLDLQVLMPITNVYIELYQKIEDKDMFQKQRQTDRSKKEGKDKCCIHTLESKSSGEVYEKNQTQKDDQGKTERKKAYSTNETPTKATEKSA